jgi:hypothetical protein
MKIQDIVNNEEWQAIRRSMVGTWKKTPEDNCKKLEEYLGDFSDYYKLRRVLNYLTGSGFRLGIIQHPAIDTLREKVKQHLKQFSK